MNEHSLTPAERREAQRATARLHMKRLMKVTAVVIVLTLIAAFSYLYATDTPMPFHFIVATVITVVGVLVLAAGLMGLLFFSSVSGADDDQN